MRDVVLLQLDGEGSLRNATYLEEVPSGVMAQLAHEEKADMMVSMHFRYAEGFKGHATVFRPDRAPHDDDPARSHLSDFIHPFMTFYCDPGAVPAGTLHLLEEAWSDFSGESERGEIRYSQPLRAFLEQHLKQGPCERGGSKE